MEKRDIFHNYELTEYYLNYFLNSNKKIQQLMMLPLIENKIFPSIWEDSKLESPIEQIFITAFELFTRDKKTIYLFEQEKIKYKDKTYYADFVFKADDYLSWLLFGNKIKNPSYKLVIECDGYEFHQKTKEQVQKDNERELALKMAGYDVLRFSGTQIFNNPLKCAEDTYNYIIKKIQEE